MYLDRATNILVGKGKHLDAAEPGGPMSVKSKVSLIALDLMVTGDLLDRIFSIASFDRDPRKVDTVWTNQKRRILESTRFGFETDFT